MVWTQERHTWIEKDRVGNWSPEKECSLWLAFRQPVLKPSSESIFTGVWRWLPNVLFVSIFLIKESNYSCLRELDNSLCSEEMFKQSVRYILNKFQKSLKKSPVKPSLRGSLPFRKLNRVSKHSLHVFSAPFQPDGFYVLWLFPDNIFWKTALTCT